MTHNTPPPEPIPQSDDLEERLQELEFLQRLDHELHYVLDLSHVLDITLDWAMRRTAADTGLVARKAEDVLHVLRVTGYAYQYAARLMREPLPVNAGIFGRVINTRKPIYMAHIANTVEPTLVYEKTRSHFTMPLLVNGEVIGVLHLESRQPAHFNQRMRNFVQHIASRAAIAIRNAEIYTRTYNSEQLKSDMIRMVAHDLRNPLNAVVNATHLLKRLRTQMPEPATKFVQSIELAANQMRTLIEELLTLERLESGIQIAPDVVDLVKVLYDAISRAQPEAVNKSQEFTVICSQESILVHGEFAYFRQVMVNLINNAIKYTPHRGKVVVRLEQHGERVFFDVSDTGYGISEDRQKQLFQRFYRAHEPGTEHIEGTGLGLSLVKTIIERSEGEVWFRSTPAQGSTFGFWLPMVPEKTGKISEEAAETTLRAAEDDYFKVTVTRDNGINVATTGSLPEGETSVTPGEIAKKPDETALAGLAAFPEIPIPVVEAPAESPENVVAPAENGTSTEAVLEKAPQAPSLPSPDASPKSS